MCLNAVSENFRLGVYIEHARRTYCFKYVALVEIRIKTKICLHLKACAELWFMCRIVIFSAELWELVQNCEKMCRIVI